jgi:ubiquinone/menaquinone biosynthesis C-methylase UbiE
MLIWIIHKKFRNLIIFRYLLEDIQKVFYKNLKKQLINSLISSILRFIFKFKLIVRYYFLIKKRIDIKLLNNFWIIRIGFLKQRRFYYFFKLDYYISNKPTCYSNLKNLPFELESCQMIYIKYFFRYFYNQNLNKIIKAWRKRLIPGGILKIQISYKNNESNLEKLKKTLNKYHFFIKNINFFDLKVNGSVLITTIKQKASISTLIDIPQKKFNDIFLILNQNKEVLSKNKKICILGYQSIKIKEFIRNLDFNNKNIQTFETSDLFPNIAENYFDCAIVANYFEYSNYSRYIEAFNELRRILKPNANILVIIPEKKYYYSKNTAHIFDKGIFTKILDEYNFTFDWINLSSSFKMIQVLIKNDNNYPLKKKKKKIFLLGVYTLRYPYLNDVIWDSQVRALEKLGYDLLIFDIKDHSFNYILKHIKLSNPDILWVSGKSAQKFLIQNADFFRSSSIKVVFWIWDIIPIIKFNFKNVIDFMFIGSKGNIPLYRKNYNLDKVYYMPVAIIPEIIHRNRFIKEKYDIGFSGQLSYSHPWYKERTEMIDFISQHFKVKIFKNIYQNLPEYYSKCKIIFGGTLFFKDLELYTSNRLFIALSNGCCYITNYFKGLEKLTKNEKHLLWYNDKNELITLLNKYLSNDDLREEIKINAIALAKNKHNYIVRIQNMLDIINGKTEDFYGFINNDKPY